MIVYFSYTGGECQGAEPDPNYIVHVSLCFHSANHDNAVAFTSAAANLFFLVMLHLGKSDRVVGFYSIGNKQDETLFFLLGDLSNSDK